MIPGFESVCVTTLSLVCMVASSVFDGECDRLGVDRGRPAGSEGPGTGQSGGSLLGSRWLLSHPTLWYDESLSSSWGS